MIAHVVTLTFVEGAGPATIDEFHTALTRMRVELGDRIVSYHHGPALGLRPDGADYAIVSVVRDEEALHHYLDSSAHQAVNAEFADRLFAERRAVQIDYVAEGGSPD
ncbi:Dabb family protein [uncultured Microbacterium sp.]|uniref:Dabb family protein n=1 Tax=uncultured Microbacterium sp. TaxID=191216 RepID=UPI0035CC1E94